MECPRCSKAPWVCEEKEGCTIMLPYDGLNTKRELWKKMHSLGLTGTIARQPRADGSEEYMTVIKACGMPSQVNYFHVWLVDWLHSLGVTGSVQFGEWQDVDFSTLEILKTDRRYTREGSSGGPDFEINYSNDSDSSFSKMLRLVSEHLGYHAEPNSVSGTIALWDTVPFRVLVKHVKADMKSVVLISDSMAMKDIIKACVEEFNLPEHVARTAYLQVSIKDEIWSFRSAKDLKDDDVILFYESKEEVEEIEN
ncbi:hypothetical protein QOT17_002972 [Balamuthia mandrillaris]